MFRLFAFSLAFLLSGCSGLKAVDLSIAADSVTTYAAIDSGKAKEGNPLLPKSAIGAAVTSAVLKKAVLFFAKKHSYAACRSVARSVFSSSVGAAVNNISVYHEGHDSVATGAAAGFGAFFFGSHSAANQYCKY